MALTPPHGATLTGELVADTPKVSVLSLGTSGSNMLTGSNKSLMALRMESGLEGCARDLSAFKAPRRPWKDLGF